MHALIPLFLNLVVVGFFYKKKSPFLAFYLVLLFVFSIPHFYFSNFGASGYLPGVESMATLHATAFFFSSIVVVVFLDARYFRGFHSLRSPLLVSSSVLRFNYKVSLFFLVLGVFLVVAAFDFNLYALFYSNWEDFRSEESPLKLAGSFFFYAGSAFLLLAFDRKSIFGFLIFAGLLVFVVFALKSRSYLIALIAPLIIHQIIFLRLSVLRIFGIFLIAASLMAAYSTARSTRHAGTIDDMAVSDIQLDVGEFELIDSFYFIVDKGGLKNTTEFGNFVRLVLLPVPSSILPFDKPRDMAMELWDAKTGSTGISGSLHPTAIGDGVMNSYYFGAIVYGVFYPVLFFILSRWLVRAQIFSPILFSVYCVVSFYWARGAFYNGFVILVFCIAALSLLGLISRAWPKGKISA